MEATNTNTNTNTVKKPFKCVDHLSKYLVELSKHYGDLDYLIKIAVSELEIQSLCIKKYQQKQFKDYPSQHKENISSTMPPSKRAKPEKQQCLAARKDKTRCEVMTSNENGMCARHANSEPQDWDVPTAVANSLPDNAVVLRKNKKGIVYWPGTCYVVKSLQEPYVVSKEITLDYFARLTPDDIQFLTKQKIPFKIIDLTFKGEQRPPKDFLIAELSKLKNDYSIESTDPLQEDDIDYRMQMSMERLQINIA
jgi:hypothetical protein